MGKSKKTVLTSVPNEPQKQPEVPTSGIVIKKKLFTDPKTLQSFYKIVKCENFEAGYLHQITTVVQELYKSVQDSDAAMQDVYTDLAVKDKGGKPVLIDKKDESDPTGKRTIKAYKFTPENQKKVNALYLDDQESMIQINRPKLNLSKVHPAGLTPMDMINLGFMIDGER